MIILKNALLSIPNTERLLRSPLDNESQLLCLVAQGNEAAFAELFHGCRDKLYGFLVRISQSPQQAEDIVQDVFLKIWINRAELENIENFSAYLFRMSHNHSLNLLKRKAKEATILLSMHGTEASSATEEHIQFRETEKLLRTAIEGLPAQQRLVYTMSREEGLNQQEISEKLHITIPTVKSHMTQALRSIRANCSRMLPVLKSNGMRLFFVLLLVKRFFNFPYDFCFARLSCLYKTM